MTIADGQRDHSREAEKILNILLIDPRPLIAKAIKMFLSGNVSESKNLVCRVGTFATAAAVPEDAAFDLLVIHVQSTAQIQTKIKDTQAELPLPLRSLPFVLYAETWQAEDVRAALQARVRGFLPISLECSEVLDALRLVAAGLSVFPPITDLRMGHGHAAPKCLTDTQSEISLTVRETEILRALQSGKSNKVIASQLGVSLSTVKVHMRSIFRKTDTQNRTEAAIVSRRILGPMDNHFS